MENYNEPENNSIVKYEFDNGYVLTLLYSIQQKYYSFGEFLFYGELQKKNETVRIEASVNYHYDSCLIHGGKREMGFDLILFEIEGVRAPTDLGLSMYYPDDLAANYETRFAAFDAGILNSTKLILNPSGEEWNIANITVEKSTFTYWDWNDPTWSDFCTYGEDTRYVASDIGLSYHPWRNMGEIEIGEEKHPVKLIFHEESMTIFVYDLSNNSIRAAMGLIGYMDKENSNKFIVKEIEYGIRSPYEDAFSNLSEIEIYKTELTEN